MTRSLLLVLLASCLIALSSAQVGGGWSFSGNLSQSDINKHQWHYKNTVAFGLNVPGVVLGGTFVSGEVNGTRGSGKIDVVSGSGYVALGGFPFAYLAFFEENYNYVTGQGAVSADVSKAAGYMGHACLWLEERDPNKNLVTRKTLQWMINLGQLQNQGFTYSLVSTSKVTDDIQFVTFAGVSNDETTPNFGVNITYLSTSVAGLVQGSSIEDIKMIPGSIESIININNYPYASTSNTLSLVMGVSTGAATVSASGQVLTSNDQSVYFSLSKNAYVGGKQVNVGITAFEVGNFTAISNNNLQAQVTGKYGAAASVKFIAVTFPAGAANIAYDPAMGHGTPAQGSASSVMASLLFIAIALFVSAF